MAFPRNSLRAFLHFAKTNLSQALEGNRKVTLVVGNESADLDSLTSSLIYAYIKSTAPPKGAFSPIYIPLLNIPASSLRLRPEFTAACTFGGISTTHLINIDDIHPEFKTPAETSWILVDHNKLQGGLGEKYSRYVRGVIDHHEEENFVPPETSPEPRMIQRAGSCTSLVIDYCKPSWDAISSASLSSGAGHAQGEILLNDAVVTQGWDAQIAKLALASILMDTANLTAPGKVEQVDKDAVEYLETKIFMSAKDAATWDRDAFFDTINQATQDLDGLSLDEILQKDYKEWTENGKTVGTSSSVKNLEYLVQRGLDNKPSASFDEVVAKFTESRNLSVFAIMTCFKWEDGSFHRQLLLQDIDSQHLTAKKFCQSGERDLGLKELELEIPRQTSYSDPKVWRNFWTQTDLTKSRKQVAPMLRAAIQDR